MRRFATVLLALFLALGLLLPRSRGHAPTATAQTPFSAFGFLTPAETVMAYYAALEARNFTAAYALLSPAVQGRPPLRTGRWATWRPSASMSRPHLVRPRIV